MQKFTHRIQHAAGTPYQIGLEIGGRLGSRLEDNISRCIQARTALQRDFPVQSWKSGALPWLMNLPSRFADEFKGMADGAGLPLQRLAEWAFLEVILDSSCTGLILEHAGQVWVARNNDIFAPDLWGYVSIREVRDRMPTITFGLEGDVFSPTGVNREKLWLHYNYLPARDRPRPDQPHLPPYAFLVEALETCRTLADLEKTLAGIQRGAAMLLFAVDGKNQQAALYECTCREARKIPLENEPLLGTNHFRYLPGNPGISNLPPRGSRKRLDRLQFLVEKQVGAVEKIPLHQKLIRILSDDEIEARQGESVTAYANAACPGRGEIWYTFGGAPAASRGNWDRLYWPWE